MDSALIIYTILQSFLLSLVLVIGKRKEQIPLAAYLLHVGVQNTLLFWINLEESNGLRIVYEFVALSRPLVIFYFLFSLLHKAPGKWIYGLALLPVLNLLADYSFQKFYPSIYFAGFYTNWYLNFPFYVKIATTVLLVRQIRVFNRQIREHEDISQLQKLQLYWGKYFIYSLILLHVLSLTYILVTLINGRLVNLSTYLFVYSAENYNTIYQVFTTISLLIFSYLVLRNPAIFTSVSPLQSTEQKIIEIVLPNPEKASGKDNLFTQKQAKAYLSVLTQVMEKENYFLIQDLSLNKLAEKTEIPPRLLSQFIQTSFKQNFKEFVNSYRVERAKILLTTNMDLTIFAIACDSGFNSESSFYKVFKDQTGLTPKQFRETAAKSGTPDRNL